MVDATFRQPGHRADDRGNGTSVERPALRPGPASVKRVLMLCYYFPPLASAGTFRTVGFTRWLHEHGWRPTVLTVRRSRAGWERGDEQVPEDIEVVRSVEWDLQQLLRVLTGVFNRLSGWLGLQRRPSVFYRWCLPDPQVAWLSTFRGARLARTCDCVYASCSPFSSALSGCLIKLLTGRPLVLDFRDPWALNPYTNYGSVQKRVLSWLEKWAVRTCNALILNTPGAERLYRTTYPADAHKMTHIPNGFDHVNLPAEQARGDRFVIMHVGDFYRARKPDRLLEALVAIGNPHIEFVHVGPVFESYETYKDKLPLRIINGVPHGRALELMRSASMLYLCQGWEAKVSTYVQVASKTYEYLATGLPILAECPPGDNVDLIRRYATRAWVVTPPDVEALVQSVTEAYALRNQHRSGMSPEFAWAFDRQRLTGELAAVLESAADGAVYYPTPPSAGSIQFGHAVETAVD
jgi:glycosyltransferase involved in cell wall biosynthesis